MKTIKQIADELNTTPQNVYNHLKRANVSRASLNPKKQGKQVLYDENAETIIKQTLKISKENDSTNKRDNETISTLEREVERLKHDNETLSNELEASRSAAQEAREEIARLRGIEDELRAQVSSLIETNKGLTILQTRKQIEAERENKSIIGRIRFLLSGKER